MYTNNTKAEKKIGKNDGSNKIAYGIGGIVIGVLLATFFTSTMFSSQQNGSFGMMNGNDNQIMGSIDKHFIEQMIPHHDGAVAMAQLALQKSKRPEIKTLATAIIEGQTKEIENMNGWYKDWFGKNVPDGSTAMMGGGMMSESGMHMGGTEEISLLENATDFDKAFIEAMIPHHQMAITMAEMLESGTSRPEMLQLAKNITASQSKEIQDMQGWYQEWYK